MSHKDTGGSAFPQPDVCLPDGRTLHGSEGMTLRDYFAAKAMVGILGNITSSAAFPSVAEMAYMMADAMLAERAKV